MSSQAGINNFIPNTVKVNSIILTNYKGSRIDITNIISELNFYENVNENGILGSIDIIDMNELIESFPICGEELIDIDVILPGWEESDNFVFNGYRVYKIINRIIRDDKIQNYTLLFTSPENIKNFETRISKAWYGNTTEKMVKDIFNELGSSKPLEIDTTIGLHNYIATNNRPYEIINYLAENRSINSNKLSDYLFFESFDIGGNTKFNFKSLGTLGKKAPIAEFHYNPITTSYDGSNVMPYTLNNIEFHKNVDIIEGKKNGLYNQTYIYHDLLRKRHVVQKNVYDDVFNESKENRLEGENSNKIFTTNTKSYGEYFRNIFVSGFPENISSSLAIDNIHNRKIEQKAGRETNNYINEKGSTSDKISNLMQNTLYRRRVLMSEFENNKIILNEVSGNYKYSVGNTIIFNKPHIVVNKEEMKKKFKSEYDALISGVYLITKTRHRMHRGTKGLNFEYVTYIEISKNTINTDLTKI